MRTVVKAQNEASGAPTILSVNDLSLVKDEPRILDTRLAEALGFQRPADIRPLINRHAEALNRFGPIIRVVRKNQGRGRPAHENYLNKRQSLYICTKAETVWSMEVTIQMVKVFSAYLEGGGALVGHDANCIRPDAPVTFSDLLDVFKLAIRKQFGNSPTSSRFEANLVEALEEMMGNPWAGPRH